MTEISGDNKIISSRGEIRAEIDKHVGATFHMADNIQRGLIFKNYMTDETKRNRINNNNGRNIQESTNQRLKSTLRHFHTRTNSDYVKVPSDHIDENEIQKGAKHHRNLRAIVADNIPPQFYKTCTRWITPYIKGLFNTI